MSKNDEKFLSVDKFREKVYKNVGTLDTHDEIESGAPMASAKPGCLNFFLVPIIRNMSLYANRKAREYYKLTELEKKADEILADREIKKLLCEKLDATINLPIDAAYKITPVLYGLALEDEERVPFNTMLFAIVSRRIVKQGVENYCAVE